MNKNLKLAAICGGVVALMTGAAFAAVPLYQLFCQVTGFDGTTMRADKAPDRVLEKAVTVRFDSNVRNLDWRFRPDQVSQDLKIGETGLAFYTVTNNSDRPVTGMASYNVVPESAGAYFSKLECFCFQEQTLQPGETMQFPVAYFVDPRIVENAETKGIEEITLSYTFYPVEPAKTEVRAAVSTAPGLGETASPGL